METFVKVIKVPGSLVTVGLAVFGLFVGAGSSQPAKPFPRVWSDNEAKKLLGVRGNEN